MVKRNRWTFVLGFTGAAIALQLLAPAFADGEFTTTCIVRDRAVVGNLDSFSGFDMLDQTNRSATQTATPTVGVWNCEGKASLDGPKVEYSATLDDPPPQAFPQGLDFGGGAIFIYSFTVTQIGVVPVGVTGVPIEVIGRVEVTASITPYVPPVFNGEVAGEVTARITSPKFPDVPAILNFSYISGQTDYVCNGNSTATGKCTVDVTLPATVQIGDTEQMRLVVSVPGNIGSTGALGVRLKLGGMADPIIQVDPDAEFSPGVRYADFAGVELSPDGVVQMLQTLSAIVALPDVNGNDIPEIGVVVPGSTRVHIRDGSTDALISDIDFGEDDALQMLVVPDLNGGGKPEIAMLNEQASGQVRVQIRDSVTGAIVKNLYYGLQYEPVAMDLVADYSGNGLPEIAVLGSEAGTDAVRVQVQDALTGTFLDNVFLGTQSIAKDLVSVTDTSSNGIPEIGILGVLKGSNQVRMQEWDAQDATFQANVWFGNVYQPQSTITMPDINTNGSDEIVAVGVDPVTQNVRVQVRDSDTTATLYNIWLGNVNEAVDIALINDINSDGFPDLAVLLKTPAGVGRVRVQSGLTGAFIRNLFYSVVENPVGLAVLPDYSGNGFDELAALGESAGIRHVQILDTSTGTQVNRIDFP